MFEDPRNTVGTLGGLVCFFSREILFHRLAEQFEPPLKMPRVDGQVDMFLKGIAAIALIPQEDGTPEIDDNGRMMRPVHMTEHGRQQFVLSNLLIKPVDQ